MTSDSPDTRLAPQLAPGPENLRLADPHLGRVLAAWPMLPEAIRRTILALVDTRVP